MRHAIITEVSKGNIKVADCKSCGQPVFLSKEELYRLTGQHARKARKTVARPPEHLTPCRYCRGLCSAQFKRLHEPRCLSKPVEEAGGAGRPTNAAADAKYIELARRSEHFEVLENGSVIAKSKKRRI